MSIRTAATRAALASGLVVAALAPTAALAAPAHAAPIRYQVTVQQGVLAKGNTVKAQVEVVNPQQNVKSWWSQAAINAVVRKAVNGGYQEPFQAQGFRCTPTVHAQYTSYLCKLTGADVPTTVWLSFSARFAS